MPAPCEKLEDQLHEDLMTWAGYIETGHSHAEKLAHEIFYVITAIIVGVWVLGNHYLSEVEMGGYINIISTILALTGLVGTYKLQESVAEAHVIVNRIRKKTGLDEVEIKHGNKSVKIFPEAWSKKSEMDKCSVLGFIPYRGIKSTGLYSWWAIYKTLYVLMFIVGWSLSYYRLSYSYDLIISIIIFVVTPISAFIIIGFIARRRWKKV